MVLFDPTIAEMAPFFWRKTDGEAVTPRQLHAQPQSNPVTV
jgi:hypothetical protein